MAACPPAPTRASDVVTIELSGEIEPKCGLSALPAALGLGQISSSGSQEVPFRVDCNTPFEYVVASREGALKNNDFSGNAAGFTNRLPYLLEIRVQIDGGVLVSRCDSADLTGSSPACGNANSGSATAIDQAASLAISWAAGAELSAGTYSDTVTLTFRPRL
jgi:hypothetical protein